MKVLSPEDISQIKKRTLLIVSIQLILAMGFIFRPASYLSHEGYIIYQSYYADVLLPFGFYFLLGLNEKTFAWLRKWWIKAIIIFAGATGAEVLQYFGFYAFGITFDPFDIIAYGTGALLAAAVDQLLFPRLFRFWKT